MDKELNEMNKDNFKCMCRRWMVSVVKMVKWVKTGNVDKGY